MSTSTETGPGAAGHDPTDDLPPVLPSLWSTVRLGYRAEPRLLVVALVMVVASSLPDALFALWLKLLADGLTADDRTRVAVAGVGMAASATLTWFLGVVLQRVERRFRDRVSIALERHVARLQASVATVEHHERPDHLDRLAVLRDQVFALDHLFLSLFTLGGWVVRLVVAVGLLMTVHPALGLLAVAALPTVVASGWRPAVERRVEEEVAPANRLARHLFTVGTTPGPGKEVRLDGLGPSLRADRRAARDRWYRATARTQYVSAIWTAAGWGVFGLAFVGALVAVTSVLDGTSGQVLLVLAIGARLSQYVGAAVGELGFLQGVWLDSSRRLTWLERYAAAIDEDADAAAPDRLERGIELDRVSFTYPGSERVVLDQVSVELPAGTVVAVVGENGAGKTTLVKLLARMYAPSAGRILVDGTDLARIPTDDWRRRMAGAFQDFFRFELPAVTSVGVGDVPRVGDRAAVGVATERSGAVDVIERLEHGLDTQLGPSWDGGVDMSHGQWQKVALARGYMRDEPLVLVLDEPTSALDAETEHALFERYARAARDGVGSGRITILVSHRFSTVRMADLILVLDGSRLVERGSHDELMAAGGHYADLYRIQADAYR